MRHLSLFIAFLVSSALAQTVVFENVNVLPMTGTGPRGAVLMNRTVVVRDGRIAEAGPAAKVRAPAGAQRVDGNRKYLMPGIAEMHGHLPQPNASPEFVDRVLFLYVANGVTAVRGMLGAPNQLELRDRINAGTVLGPRLFVGSPPLGGGQVKDGETASRLVKEYKAAGYDHLKVQEGLQRSVYDAIVETAKASQIQWAGHVAEAVGLPRCIESGQSSVDHLDDIAETIGMDMKNLPPVIASMKKHGTWNVPTMALWDVFLGAEPLKALEQRTELQYMPKSIVDEWSSQIAKRRAAQNDQEARRMMTLRPQILKALRDNGVNIVFGTDSPQLFSVPGFSIHREMQAMVAAGLTPYDVLVSGTRKPAEYYKAAAEWGTVEPGRRADLILLTANPLDGIANLQKRAGVMVRGRWLPETEIQKRLAEFAAKR